MCSPIFSWEIGPAISELVLITTSSSLYPEGQLTWLCAFPFSLNSTVELIHRNITSIQR